MREGEGLRKGKEGRAEEGGRHEREGEVKGMKGRPNTNTRTESGQLK